MPTAPEYTSMSSNDDAPGWESIVSGVIHLADMTKYAVTVWSKEAGPPANDVNYTDKLRTIKQVLLSYDGLDQITPKQIYDDVVNSFQNIVAIDITNDEGDGFHWAKT